MSSTPAQQTLWSIAPQNAQLGASTPVVSGMDWYKYRVVTITGRGMQDQALMPLELSGILTPTGGYKMGAYFVQEVDIIPRLEDDIGWLLYATLGNVSSVQNAKYTNAGWVTNTGAYGHYFRMNPTDQADIPYLAARIKVPGPTGASADSGEVGYDCRASGLRLNIPGAGMITGRFGVQGRAYINAPTHAEVNAWTYVNAFEDSTSIAHSGTGSINIGTHTPKITGLVLDIINNLSRPQDEMIVGSFNPDDVIVLSRSARLRATVKWENATLWNALYYGGANQDWTNLPEFQVTSGSTRAFYFEANSPDNMPSLSVPYSLRIIANNVMLSCDPTSLRFRPGSILEYMINIDILDPASPYDYIAVALDNKATAYTWPT